MRAAARNLLARLNLGDEQRWLVLYAGARLVATAVAATLIAWSGLGGREVLLLLYGPVSTLILVLPAARRSPAVWVIDSAATLGLVLQSGDWRSPFYLLWLTALVLPAVSLPLVRGLALAIAAPVAFFLLAIVGGPAPGRLQLVSTETLAIHVTLPFLLVSSLAYSADALRRLWKERTQRERLAIEAERRRIAWELHDSAKQRLHAAHLLVSSLHGRVPEPLERLVGRAAVELESASSDMDTSLAELRSPLEGRRLDDALRTRAAEMTADGGPPIAVRGRSPTLAPLVGAHVYRIACEALTNALRHADATAIEVTLANAAGNLELRVSDDGRGLSRERRDGATGLFAMESRAATIGGQLTLRSPDDGPGTVVELYVPMNENGGPV